MAELFAGGHLRFINGAWRDDNGDAVDIAEVVRCKDCKHYHTHNRSVRFDCKELYCCRSALQKVGPEDFCSFGERKDNDNRT